MNYLTEAKNLELDQIKTSIIHSQIISSKPILKQIYADYYQFFNSQLKRCPQGPKVELGSGGGFIKEFMPEIFTSDLVPLPKCDLITSATNLPFQDCSVAAIMLVNVFHHIDNVFDFLKESERILLPGGYLLMIEPEKSSKYSSSFTIQIFLRLHKNIIFCHS